jgi:hypothetical protein
MYRDPSIFFHSFYGHLGLFVCCIGLFLFFFLCRGRHSISEQQRPLFLLLHLLPISSASLALVRPHIDIRVELKIPLFQRCCHHPLSAPTGDFVITVVIRQLPRSKSRFFSGLLRYFTQTGGITLLGVFFNAIPCQATRCRCIF